MRLKTLTIVASFFAAIMLPSTLSNLVTAKGPVCVDDNPYAYFTGTDLTGTVELTADFDSAYSQPCSGDIAFIDWDFGDGQTATGPTATHTFSAGEWPVTLTITNTNNLSDTYTRNVSVRESNAQPVAGDDNLQFYTRYEYAQNYAVYYSDIRNNDSDADGDSLTYGLVSNATNGAVDISASGIVTYTPNNGHFGNDTFTYSVDDGFGGSDTAEVTIETIWSNSSYVNANSDYASATEDEVATVNVLSNDVDYEGDELFVSSIEPVLPSLGQAWINPDNTISFLPTAQKYFSSVHVRYTASDAYGATGSTFISFTVTSVNDAPVASDLTLTVDEDKAVSFNPTTSATDVDSNSTGFDAEITSQPSNGTVTHYSGDTYTYTPSPEYNGPDSFTFVVYDSDGAVSNEATAYVDVVSVYDPLVVVSESVSTDEDIAVSGNVLANDTWETPVATSSVDRQPFNGTVTMSDNGDFTYTPNPNYNGSDSFTYIVNDGVTTDSGYVSIFVNSVNDAPVAIFSYLEGKGRRVSFDATASYDLEGPLTYEWSLGDGTTATGSRVEHRYRRGTYTVTLKVTDFEGAVATTTQQISL